MFEELKSQAETKMHKSIVSLKQELVKLRTGRAHPSILESIMVDYYGSPTPMNQVASISVSDPRTLSVTPFDKAMTPTIDKAIRNSNLGLNPVTAGQVIRVPLPPLTEERRLGLVKQLKASAEDARVSVRNIRRDANNQIKSLLKSKKITEDEERDEQDNIQKITNNCVSDIEKIVKEKEADLLQV